MIYLDILLAEWKKICWVHFIPSLLGPVVLTHGVVLFNMLSQGLANSAGAATNYYAAILANWYTFFAIISCFYVVYSFWRPELKNGCWARVSIFPVPIYFTLYTKLFLLLSFIVLQGLLLVISATLIARHLCLIPSCFNFDLTDIVRTLCAQLMLTPAIIFTCAFVVRLKKAGLVMVLAVTPMIVNLFLISHDLSLYNPWSWGWLWYQDRLGIALVLSVSAILLVMIKKMVGER